MAAAAAAVPPDWSSNSRRLTMHDKEAKRFTNDVTTSDCVIVDGYVKVPSSVVGRGNGTATAVGLSRDPDEVDCTGTEGARRKRKRWTVLERLLAVFAVALLLSCLALVAVIAFIQNLRHGEEDTYLPTHSAVARLVSGWVTTCLLWSASDKVWRRQRESKSRKNSKRRKLRR